MIRHSIEFTSFATDQILSAVWNFVQFSVHYYAAMVKLIIDVNLKASEFYF